MRHAERDEKAAISRVGSGIVLIEISNTYIAVLNLLKAIEPRT